MSEKGQSLVEVIVALGIAVIVITAIVISVVSAVINTQTAKTENLATYYAKQGLEIVREASRSDWALFETNPGSKCLGEDAISLSDLTEKYGDYCTAGTNNFRREVVIEYENSDCELVDPTTEAFGTKITVIVSWTDNKCVDDTFCHEVRLDSCLQNIYSSVSEP